MRRTILGAIIVAILLFAVMVIYNNAVNSSSTLPVYNPADLNPELVAESRQNVSKNHTVLDFTLTNQNGETITQQDYQNAIYVTDFFFTRCPSICPIMTDNMGKLQLVFMDDDNVKFLSISVTPEFDSIPLLKKYALKNKALSDKWNITTGDKKHIYTLARESYFAVTDQGDGGLQDFIHTPNFVLVDKQKRIRGIYDGTKDEEINRLIDDIRLLQ